MDIKNAASKRKFNKNITIKRVWGDNRQETNAKVLEMFSNKNESTLVVAKDGMDKFTHLVDSMSAALLGYPIVLSTNTLINDQIKSIRSITESNSKLIQVGYGIDKDIINRIKNNM